MDFSERLLYHIWDAQHIVKKPLTMSGKQVVVMYQGQWNTDFGADFRNCIINIDGEVLRGSIEIHLRTYDWTAHKHDEDANYNNTILHIVYQHTGNIPYTITENGNRVEILELKDYLDQDMAKLIKKFEQTEVHYPELCCFFAGIDPQISELLFRKLGTFRMEKKVKRYSAELFFSDFNQLLYQGIMEAGGYSKNSYNMLQLALQYPYVDIIKWRENGLTDDHLTAIMLWGSGLQEHLPKSIPPETAGEWERLYQEQTFTDKTITAQWNLFRIRPANHPVIRIIQVVNFLSNIQADDLLSFFIELLSTEPLPSIRKLTARLADTFNSPGIPPSFRIGTNRIDIIMINIIIPVMLLYTEKTNNRTLLSRIWHIFEQYPGLTSNYIEAFMKQKYLNASQQAIVNKKAAYQQGLLKLYYDYCRYHNCRLCETHKKDLILSM